MSERLPASLGSAADLAVDGNGRAALLGAGGRHVVLGVAEPARTPHVTRVATPAGYELALVQSKLLFPADGRVAFGYLAHRGHRGAIPSQLVLGTGTADALPTTARIMTPGCAASPPCTILAWDAAALRDGALLLAWLETADAADVDAPSVLHAGHVDEQGVLRSDAVLSTRGTVNSVLTVDTDADGDPLVSWIERPASGGGATRVSRRGEATGTWAPAVRAALPVDPHDAILTLKRDRDGNEYAFWEDAGAAHWRIRAAHRTAGGAFSSPKTIARFRPHDGPLVTTSYAVGEDGRAAVAWGLRSFADGGRAEGRARGSLRVRVATPDGRWGTPRRLARRTTRADTVSVALDRSGRMLATWQQLGDGSRIGGVLSATGRAGQRLTHSTQVRRKCSGGFLIADPSGHAGTLLQCGRRYRLARFTP